MQMEKLRQHLPGWTRHCSERERRAQNIEYDAIKIKSLEFMRTKLGEEYDGLITAVLNWGFFVELIDPPVEGLVHVRKLDDDFYEFDEERQMLTGRQSGNTFKLGDKVKVMVENVNMLSLELDYALISKVSGKAGPDKKRDLHRTRTAAATRHKERRPTTGGFQKRGGRKRR